MKLRIHKSALAAALALVARVVERRNTMPILSNALLEAAGDSLTITATDIDIEMKISVVAEVETAGATTAPAHMLSQLTAKFADGLVAIEALSDGVTLKVGAGRASAKLQTLPAEDFPSFGSEEAAGNIALPAHQLAALLDATSFAMSSEETRYYLCGIFAHVDSAGLFACVATDGHRLARARIEAPAWQGLPGVIIPRKTVGEIGRLAHAAAKADETVSIALTTNRIRVSVGDTVLTSKLVDGTFPDYERVIPSKWATEVQFGRAEMAAALDRVRCVLSTSKALKFTFVEGHVTLSATDADSGSASEEVGILGDGAVEIGFNAAYIAAALNALAADKITARLSDPGTPIILLPSELGASDRGPDRLVVVMPMRV